MDLEDLAHVTLVAGAPRSGKTEFALDMLIAAMKRYGDADDGVRQTDRRHVGRSRDP